MKKLLIAFLAITLAVSFSIPAYAEKNNGEDTSFKVNGKYLKGNDAPETVAADVVWDDITFTYRNSADEWNAGEHKYTPADGRWDSVPKYVSVTNRSNITVLCTVIFELDNGILGGFGQATGKQKDEFAAYINSPKTAYYNSFKWSLYVTGGKPAANGDIGTVTVTLSKGETE